MAIAHHDNDVVYDTDAEGWLITRSGCRIYGIVGVF